MLRNPKYSVWLTLCLALLVAVPTPAQTLDGLKPEHPRLLADAERFEQVRRNVAQDPLARQWYEQVREEGLAMLDQPVTRYHLRDGRRLLYESREVKARVLTLGLLHKLEPNERYLQRIWADLEAAAAFPDWHPAHFLDVAEMALAFAIAYDWLYDDWTEQQRETIREALVTHGLRTGLRAYEEGAWWARSPINWNQVCNGGLIAAAVALADEEPELASSVIDYAVASLPKSMDRYAPEGGYDEGPGYWSFGTTYNVFAIAALESALGHSFGLAERAGFDVTALFPIHLTGPTNRVFNFADSHDRELRSATLLYLAKRYHLPGCARYAAKHNDGSPLGLLWYDPALLLDEAKPMPLTALYEKVGVAALRSAWDDPEAMYLAVKAGPMPTGHGQLDLGSFIYEDRGVRWFIDLGADDYNLPGYFHDNPGGDRWQYYRNRAEGHNTLVVNPDHRQDQRPGKEAPIQLDGQVVRVELSAVYGIDAQRRFDFDPQQRQLTITDTLASDEPADVWWFAHTGAQVQIADDGRSAVLELEGKKLSVTLESPADARFTVMPARPLATSPNPEGQNPNDGSEKLNTAPGSHFVLRGETARYGEPDPANAARKLAIHLPQLREATLQVRLRPLAD